MRSFFYRLALCLANYFRPKSHFHSSEELKRAVFSYNHPELIRRLVERHEMTLDQAEAAFWGMKQYLYLVGTQGGDLSPQSESVDEAWHNFMLFSRDYEEFCMKYFGLFIHHQPFTEEMGEVVSMSQGVRCGGTGCKALVFSES